VHVQQDIAEGWLAQLGRPGPKVEPVEDAEDHRHVVARPADQPVCLRVVLWFARRRTRSERGGRGHGSPYYYDYDYYDYGYDDDDYSYYSYLLFLLLLLRLYQDYITTTTILLLYY